MYKTLEFLKEWEFSEEGQIFVVRLYKTNPSTIEEKIVVTDRVRKKKLRPLLLKRQQGKCIRCDLPQKEHIHRKFDIHRVIPGKYGGEYTEENTILVCRKCHLIIEGMSLAEILSTKEVSVGRG